MRRPQTIQAMTVKDLKNKLSGMPDDAVILFCADNDFTFFWEVSRVDEGFYSQENPINKTGYFYTEHQEDIADLSHAVCLFDHNAGNVW